jgi:multiple sugar transport system permease protein
MAVTASGAAPARRPRRPRRRGARTGRSPILLAGPFLLLFAVFYLVPIGYAVWESLYKSEHVGGGVFSVSRTVFAGLGNYTQVLGDRNFLSGLLRVALFGVIQVPVMLVLAALLALLLDSGAVRFARFFRLASFLPYAVPGVLAAIVWGFLYSPGLSPIAQALGHTPLGTVDFLSANLVLWSIGNIVTWSWTGYNMLIIYAALQAVPREIYEAARLDGTSEWQLAVRIKLPMVFPALILTGVFSVIGTLQLFTEPSVLSKLTGTVTSYYTPNLMAYTAAFVSNNLYLSAAISVTLAVITFVASFTLLRLTWRRALEA